MTKRAFWFGIVAWALVLPGLGCDSVKSCQTLCEQSNECPNVDMPIDDCQQACTDREKLLTTSDCTTKQQEYDECASKLGDVCVAPQQCTTEALALIDCIDDYCTANPADCGGGS